MSKNHHARLKTTIATLIAVVGLGLHGGSVAGQTEAHGDVPTLISQYAALYGANPVQLERVAWCESRFLPHAFNPRDGTVGVFQFNRITWEELAPQIGVSGDFREAYAAPSNIAVAAYGFALGQSWRWGCK